MDYGLFFIFSCTDLAAPGNFSVLETTTDSITVTWTDAPGDKEQYYIFCENSRSPDVPAKKSNDTVSRISMTATCSGLTPGTAYNVTIETRKDGGLWNMEDCEDDCLVKAVTGKPGLYY